MQVEADIIGGLPRRGGMRAGVWWRKEREKDWDEGIHWSWRQHVHPRALAAGNLALAFPGGSDGKESACNAGDLGSIPGLGRSPGGGHGNPLQCSCLEDPHGQRTLMGYCPWGRKESDMTEQLRTQSSTERIIWHADRSVSSLILLKFIRRKLQQKQSPQRHIPKNTMISASTAKH